MIIPFVGPTYQMDALSFDIQRSINLYPLISETGTSVTPSSMQGTPGKELFAEVGGGPIRAELATANGRGWAVSGNELYEVNTNGTGTLRGTLNSATSRCFMAENGTQVMIVDGTDGYIYNMDTDVFAEITDPQFPGAGTVTFQDGYFIINRPLTQEYYISALYDGLSWDALDFGTSESNPDNLVACLSDSSNLWLLGERSLEVHQNTGAQAFPFERIPGAVLQVGCTAPGTLVRFDNTVAWLGVDEQGRGVVWKGNGYAAQRISTQAIEKRIAEAADFSESYAWVYHEQGHIFLCIQIRGLDTTLVYDGAVGQWHERSSNNDGELSQDRGSSHMFFAQKSLVGDRASGKIYWQALHFYSEDGAVIVRERILPHLVKEKQQITYASFELDMQVGVGNPDVTDPQIMLQYSNDGGRNWSYELWRPIGAIGAFNTRVRWQKLGTARDRVFKVKISDQVQVQINGAYLNANP